MNSVNVFLINSFTLNGKGGNPAGVVLNSEQLSNEQKQYIAKQLGILKPPLFINAMKRASM